jgi:hypothetical protein
LERGSTKGIFTAEDAEDAEERFEIADIGNLRLKSEI